jgi:hypothetical protein
MQPIQPLSNSTQRAAVRAPLLEMSVSLRAAVLLGLAPLLALAATLGCAHGGCGDGDSYRAVGCRAAAARDTLVFGMPREAAIDAIGRAEVVPPWRNRFGLGPAIIQNPFDELSFTSPLGEEYEVVRYYIAASGKSRCPVVSGELRLEPLIFFDGKLVGWDWPYLADVLGRRITAKETHWTFGAFCDQPPAGALDESEANPDSGARSSPRAPSPPDPSPVAGSSSAPRSDPSPSP